MERLACINIPYLALQVLLREHPEWQNSDAPKHLNQPVVVIDKDTPQGIVLQYNKAASAYAIRVGMRFSTARSLCAHVNAGIVSPHKLEKTLQHFHADLFEFCPEIDLGSYSALIPIGQKFRFSGTAWLRVTGLDQLFGSYENWAKKLYDHLKISGLTPSIAISFSRFGAYVLSKRMKTGILIPKSKTESRKLIYESRMEDVELEVKALKKLSALGIHTIGDFLKLPPHAIQKRFGLEAYAFWKESSDLRTQILNPIRYEKPLEENIYYEQAEWDATRLLFSLKASLHRLCLRLRIRSYDLKKITLIFLKENGERDQEIYQPATPSNDESRWIALIRLRLDRMKLNAAISEIKMIGEGIPYFREQTHLLYDIAKRDPHTTQHAIEEIRAAFGPSSVKKAILEDEHLAHMSYRFVDIDRLPRPQTKDKKNTKKVMCRRIFDDAIPLSHFDSEMVSYITIKTLEEGGIETYSGPFSISGGWWESWYYRDYYFAKTHRGDLYWLYFDQRSRQLFCQGFFE